MFAEEGETPERQGLFLGAGIARLGLAFARTLPELITPSSGFWHLPTSGNVLWPSDVGHRSSSNEERWGRNLSLGTEPSACAEVEEERLSPCLLTHSLSLHTLHTGSCKHQGQRRDNEEEY